MIVPKKGLRFAVSILANFLSFLVAYAGMQYFVTRNLAGSPVGIPKLCLNFAFAGLISGAVYWIIRKNGSLIFALIPSLALGILLVLIRGTNPALPIVVGALTGIAASLLGAYLCERITRRS
jgi:hypothetical protein